MVQSLNINIGRGLVIFERLGGGLVICRKFNYSVVINILYLEGKPVLQVIDSATLFGATRFLKDMSA